MQSIDRDVPVYNLMPLSMRLDRALAHPNFFTIMLCFFGGFSLLLTLIHGYSLCANSMEQRTRELGIRSAVGATPAQLRWLILRQMMPALLAGLCVGFVLSSSASKLLGHWI